MDEYLVEQDGSFFYIRYEFADSRSPARWTLYTVEGVFISALNSVATELDQNSNQLLVIDANDEFSFFEIIASYASTVIDDVSYVIQLSVALILNQYFKLVAGTLPKTCRYYEQHPYRYPDLF